MSAQILDGKALSKNLRDELKARVDRLRAKGVVPRLDVLVAAQDPSSLAYVNMKHKWAEAAGMVGESYHVDESWSQAQLID